MTPNVDRAAEIAPRSTLPFARSMPVLTVARAAAP